jgi:photosystem II stability/assembly factor-like uncharacterized protein
MQKRLWGVSAASLALTCLTVTGCGVSVHPLRSEHEAQNTVRDFVKEAKILKLQLIGNQGFSVVEITYRGQRYICIATSPNEGRIWYISKNSMIPTYLMWPLDAPISPNEVAFHFLNSSSGWFLVEEKNSIEILKTNNEGKTWIEHKIRMNARSTSAGNIFVDFNNMQNGWILVSSNPALQLVSSSLYSTNDGGTTWTKIHAKNIPISGKSTGITFINKNTGFLTKNYPDTSPNIPLYATFDSGQNWTKAHVKLPFDKKSFLYSNAYPPVFFSQSNGLFLVTFMQTHGTRAAVYTTTDGGHQWNPGRASLIKVNMSGSRISDYFLNPNIGWMLSEGGYLWIITDYGQKWTRIAHFNNLKNIKSAPQMYFTNRLDGWILFQTSTQTDLYQSDDGGVSWHRIHWKVRLDSPQSPA